MRVLTPLAKIALLVLSAGVTLSCAVAENPAANAAPSLSRAQWYELMQWPAACNAEPTSSLPAQYPIVAMQPNAEGGGLLVVMCTPGLTYNCGLVYPVKSLQSPRPAQPLVFEQVVRAPDGEKHLVTDAWICGRGGATTQPGDAREIAFEQTSGPGDCGIANIYSTSVEATSPRSPISVRELSCSAPARHQRKLDGTEYESVFDWPTVQELDRLPTMAPFVERDWPALRLTR